LKTVEQDLNISVSENSSDTALHTLVRLELDCTSIHCFVPLMFIEEAAESGRSYLNFSSRAAGTRNARFKSLSAPPETGYRVGSCGVWSPELRVLETRARDISVCKMTSSWHGQVKILYVCVPDCRAQARCMIGQVNAVAGNGPSRRRQKISRQ
jgi:hypothetical protein